MLQVLKEAWGDIQLQQTWEAAMWAVRQVECASLCIATRPDSGWDLPQGGFLTVGLCQASSVL